MSISVLEGRSELQLELDVGRAGGKERPAEGKGNMISPAAGREWMHVSLKKSLEWVRLNPDRTDVVAVGP